MTVSAGTFAFVADLVRRRSAIVLEPGKEYLVESRLLPLARDAGHADVDAYVSRVRRAPDEAVHDAVVEALTTNETSWFRDVGPFDALRDHIVPAWRDAGRGTRLRVWSAACSTGQEPYSIAMALADHVPAPGLDVLATDLSEQVLERARRGLYSQLEVNRGMPAPLLVRHLTRVGSGWQVADDVRRAVTFRRHNLLDAPPVGGPFDIVFLRNVLIYFDPVAKRAVLERVRGALRPGGWLVLGAAETTVGVHDGFERVVLGRTAVYRVGAPARQPLIPSPASSPVAPRPPVTAGTAPVSTVPTTIRGAGLR